MTQILFVLDPQFQSTETLDDPRPPRELVKLINTGELIIGQALAQRQTVRLAATLLSPLNLVVVSAGTPPFKLQARHYDILHGMADGKSAEQIAQEKNIAPRTVYQYIHELKERFGVSTREEVMVMAVANGLL